MSLYIYLYLLDSHKLTFRRASLSPKHQPCILQQNQKLSVSNGLNLLLGRKIRPCPGTTGPCFGCSVYHALIHMETC